jgi:hypothetical protein
LTKTQLVEDARKFVSEHLGLNTSTIAKESTMGTLVSSLADFLATVPTE